MSEDTAFLRPFITALFIGWKRCGIRYVILRNYEELPEHTSNDIDILLDRESLVAAVAVLQKEAKAHEWRIHNIVKFACHAFYLHHEKTLQQVHFDFLTDFRWRGLLFLDSESILDGRRLYKTFYVPEETDEAAVSLMTRLVYAGDVKRAYRARISLAALAEPQTFVGRLEPYVGTWIASKIVSLAANEDWPEISRACAKVRRNLLLRNMKSPHRLLLRVACEFRRYVLRVRNPPGICAVIMGPDGAGKSTVGRAVRKALGKTFYEERSLHCHWKPHHGQGGSSVTNPHAQLPRSKLMSALFFTYHLLGFAYGWHCCVTPVRFRNGMALIDRFYYDFYIDPLRYRLKIPLQLIRAGEALVGKPDLIFVLDAPADVLHARKGELEQKELKRQREEYRIFIESRSNGQIVDADQPLLEVAQTVTRHILSYMTRRAKNGSPLSGAYSDHLSVDYK